VPVALPAVAVLVVATAPAVLTEVVGTLQKVMPPATARVETTPEPPHRFATRIPSLRTA
jgi:hypothetical protein